jgi:CxxC motif-containing protein (DUF1111 family)
MVRFYSRSNWTRIIFVVAISVLWFTTSISAELTESLASVPSRLTGLASSQPLEVQTAYRHPAADLPPEKILSFQRGKAVFDLSIPNWAAASRILLGPSNASSCIDCHIHSGRGALQQGVGMLGPPAPLVGFVAAVAGSASVPTMTPITATGAKQVLRIWWEELDCLWLDGDRQCRYVPRGENWASGVRVDHLRIAPPLIGLSLLEDIEDSQILQWHQTHQLGVVPYSVSTKTGLTSIGRFGLKSQWRTIRDFVEHALTDELGVRPNSLLSERDVSDLVVYTGELAVPGRQSDGESIRAGFGKFKEMHCAVCHRPNYKIDRRLAEKLVPMQIWPFTDMLLHNLSNGPNGRQDELWRTSPLWGIGRSRDVLGFGAYMHDGRANTLVEAILWHGGEASRSREQFLNASPEERALVLAFLQSL